MLVKLYKKKYISLGKKITKQKYGFIINNNKLLLINIFLFFCKVSVKIDVKQLFCLQNCIFWVWVFLWLSECIFFFLENIHDVIEIIWVNLKICDGMLHLSCFMGR